MISYRRIVEERYDKNENIWSLIEVSDNNFSIWRQENTKGKCCKPYEIIHVNLSIEGARQLFEAIV